MVNADAVDSAGTNANARCCQFIYHVNYCVAVCLCSGCLGDSLYLTHACVVYSCYNLS